MLIFKKSFTYDGAGIDDVMSARTNGSVNYYLEDHSQSVRQIVNGTGAINNQYIYATWGESVLEDETIFNPFGYTGREFGETNKNYFRARYQDGGRFLSPDPMETAKNIRVKVLGPTLGDFVPIQFFSRDIAHSNLYTYVQNNPVQFFDPSGLKAQIPGCDRIPDCLETRHLLKCCDQHDRCYEQFNCTEHSWRTTAASIIGGIIRRPPVIFPKDICDLCNQSAIACVLGFGPD